MIPEQIIIDRGSNIPIADQIYDQIFKMILYARLDPGEKLPPERDLSAELGVSRGTIRRVYARLEKSQAIGTRKGSGSFVLQNGRILERSQKKEAVEIIMNSFLRLKSMGLSDKEILNLINLHISTRNSISKINIMVVSNNHEVLAQLEQQLSYLSEMSLFMFTLSFFTLDSVEMISDPMQTLHKYSLIIATSIDYQAIVNLLPAFRGKIIEATISPRTTTLVQLGSLPKDSRINIVYRTTVFRNMIDRTLRFLDFPPENLFYYYEYDYNPARHSDNGVSVVINFNESPVYVDPAFKERNAEFEAAGGQFILFEYRIERSALLHIEDRIQDILNEESLLADR